MSFVPLSALTGEMPSITSNSCDELPSLGPRPLFQKFATDSKRYAYDVNTGAIIEVTHIVYELLDYLPFPNHAQGLTELEFKLNHEFSPVDIATGIEQLKRLNAEFGLFKPISIRTRMYTPEMVKSQVSQIVGRLGQLVLSVAEECNLRCSYCSYSGGYVNTRAHNSTMMSWDVAKRSMDFFLQNMRTGKKNEVTFYGGEPLINFALLRNCIDYIRQHDPEIGFGLTTNGTLLTDEVMETFVESDIRTLISLDGPEGIHDKERRFVGGQSSFGRIMRNVKRFHDRFPEYFRRRVKFWCTLRPEDDDEQVVQFFVENADLFHGNVGFGKVAPGHSEYDPYPSKSGSASKLERQYLNKVVTNEVNDAEFAVLREMFEKPYLRLQYRPRNAAGFGETTHAMGACFPGNYRVFVKANGTFQICEKSNDSLVIGHIDSGFDVDRIVEIYTRFYELHNRECRVCWAYRLCPSCYASTTRETGRFESTLDSRYCNNVRTKWTGLLTNFTSVLERSPKGFRHSAAQVAERIPVLDD